MLMANQNGNKSGLIIGIPDCAKFLGVSVPTIYNYLKIGGYCEEIEKERKPFSFRNDFIDNRFCFRNGWKW